MTQYIFLLRMFRNFLLASMTLTLAWSTIACVPISLDQPTATAPQVQQPPTQASPATELSDGEYPVQQVTYDDSIGEYAVVLLNTRAGEPSIYRTTNLPMARLTDEQIQAGDTSQLQVENGEPALYLTEDFRIEYVHNVTETQTNPQTGQQEVVVVRQESSFWTPFAGALAGQAIGSLLFRPQYYFPPVYQPGVTLTGYGGYGSTYTQAADRYRSRYQAPPLEVRNRQAFRTTGQLRTSSSSDRIRPSQSPTRTRATGSGFGNSDLRRSPSSTGTRSRRQPSFGSGGSRGGFRRAPRIRRR
ncbi:MAG: hypothetical protein Kow00121_18690 [Elainellaceae cyanobacterium]